MSVVSLEILEPHHDAVFAGAGAVRMRGQVNSTGHGPLFFKWYSSLNVATGIGDAHVNGPGDNPMDFTRTLGVGSHVLTLAAKDVEGDALADITSVQDSGMAGGPSSAESPCIIHVFIAQMITPAPTDPAPTLSKISSILEAVAPVQWGVADADDPGSYGINPDYLSVNRIRYVWRFQPLGAPAGRNSADLTPAPQSLAFDPESHTPEVVVRYQGALPPSLDGGDYTLILRVEDAQDANVGHQVSRQVVIAV